MIKNNKGFMLAEVVIVSTVIITTLVTLYTSFNRLYLLYNNRNNYYNIDGIYASKKIVNYLLPENRLNNILSSDAFKNYIYIISNSTCNNAYLNNNLCTSLITTYKIKNVVITKANNTYTNKDNKDLYFGKNNISINETFKDYLKYLSNYYSKKTDYKDSYLIIIEYGSNNNLYYSNLVLR